MRLLRVPRAAARRAEPLRERDERGELAGDGAPCPASTKIDVRWSASTSRSSSSSATVVTVSPGSPSRWSTVTGASGGSASSSTSLMSESTIWLMQCPISSGPCSPAAVDRERLPVDEPRAVHRIDAEPGPGEIRERDAGDDLERDRAAPFGLAQHRHGPFGDRRVPGHGVADLAVLGRGRDEVVGDPAVQVVEVLGGLVAIVEGHEVEPVLRRARRSRDAARSARSGAPCTRASNARRAASGRRRPGRARRRRRARGSLARRAGAVRSCWWVRPGRSSESEPPAAGPRGDRPRAFAVP